MYHLNTYPACALWQNPYPYGKEILVLQSEFINLEMVNDAASDLATQ